MFRYDWNGRVKSSGLTDTMAKQVPGTPDPISELREDHEELIGILYQEGKITLLTRVEDAFRKTLIIAAASYFEVQLAAAIGEIYCDRTQNSRALTVFVQKQAFGRHYAQLFSWKSHNANYFFAFFGQDFKTYMQKKVQEEKELDEAVKAFLEIGNLRNQMVHENYADFQLNKTADEVFTLYQVATKFVHEFPAVIQDFIDQGEPQIQS